MEVNARIDDRSVGGDLRSYGTGAADGGTDVVLMVTRRSAAAGHLAAGQRVDAKAAIAASIQAASSHGNTSQVVNVPVLWVTKVSFRYASTTATAGPKRSSGSGRRSSVSHTPAAMSSTLNRVSI